MKAVKPSQHNPGPSWGYHFLETADRVLPNWLFKILLKLGVIVAMMFMPKQRGHSKSYWLRITGKEPKFRDEFKHFYTFTEGLIQKLRTSRNIFPKFTCTKSKHSKPFVELCQSEEPAIFGTFHVGYSDLMGCLLSDFGRKVSILRLKRDNSHDTDLLSRIFENSVKFIWVNDSNEFIFEVKKSLQNNESIALQCDRLEGAGKFQSAHFLGAHRDFPSTIYYLSYLFKVPATIAFTGPNEDDGTINVYPSSIFYPLDDRPTTMKAAQEHFQDVLNTLEEHLKIHPELWFNFEALNPVSKSF